MQTTYKIIYSPPDQFKYFRYVDIDTDIDTELDR